MILLNTLDGVHDIPHFGVEPGSSPRILGVFRASHHEPIAQCHQEFDICRREFIGEFDLH